MNAHKYYAATPTSHTLWDFIAAAKRTTGGLHERAAQILDLLEISDPLCNHKHNDTQVDWALTAAHRSLFPECKAISIWHTVRQSGTKKVRACIFCGEKSTKHTSATWAAKHPECPTTMQSEREDKAKHFQEFREFYKKRETENNLVKYEQTPFMFAIDDQTERPHVQGALPLGKTGASLGEYIKAARLFPAEKKKVYTGPITVEERAYKTLRLLFPTQDHKAYSAEQVEQALVAVYRSDNPKSGAVTLWRHEKKSGTKSERACILCGASSTKYASPSFCAKHPDHPNSTKAEREDKTRHLDAFREFIVWKMMAQPPSEKTIAKMKTLKAANEKEKPSAKISKPKQKTKANTKGNKAQAIKKAQK